MDTSSSRYDPELQMFADRAREPDMAHLHFLRWMAEQGKMEHETAGESCGEYAPQKELVPA